MAVTTNQPSDFQTRRLRFVAIGLAVLLVAAMVGGTAIGLKTVNRLNAIQSEWLDFKIITANKGQALSQVRKYFGFGGFIHNFQNYVSRGGPGVAGVVNRDLDELEAALSTYEVVGVTQAERKAITDIRKVIAIYRKNLIKAKNLISGGGNKEEISRLTRVDNRDAFAALAALEVNWLEALDKQTKKLTAGVAEGQQLIKLMVIFVPILALSVIALLWFMQRLVQVTVKTVEVDKELRKSEEKNRLFAADVAHELRMPLAVMRLHLENLEDRKTADAMLLDVEKMARMLEQLLAAAKIESWAVDLRPGVDIHAICVDIGAQMAPLAIKEGRYLEVLGPESPVLIKANPFALEQAVRNLVENSIKYASRETKIIIEVTDEPAIKVTDKGPGIPAELRETIFDPFLRSDQRGEGSGLGLSIVRRAAEVHNAKINIADAPGGGSIFSISFPTP